MLIVLVVIVACNALVTALLGVLAVRYVANVERRLGAGLRAFVSSPDDKTPSPLAVVVDQFATMFAGRVMQGLESRLRGAAGSPTASDDTIREAAAGNPLIALAAGFLPKGIRQQLIRNPQMLGALTRLAGGGQAPTGDNNHGETPRQSGFSL